MARKNSVVSVEVTDDNSAIAFLVEGHKPIILTVSGLSADITAEAILHGLKQKVSDAAALPKNDDGTAASASDKHAAMQAVVDRLVSGEWNKRGTGDGETAPSGLIRRAAKEWLKSQRPDLSDEKFDAWYEAKDRKAVLALRTVPEIASIMERMKAERGTTAKVDASALLAELD